MRLAAIAGLLAGLALIGQGCATPFVYGPIGDKQPFGYKDRENPDGGHTLLVVMPGNTLPPALRDVWDRRAQELCADGTDRTTVFRVDHINGTSTSYSNGIATSSRVWGPVEMEGYVYCKAVAAKPEAKAVAPTQP